MKRQEQIRRSLERLGTERFRAFLRAALDSGSCTAVRLINERLDEGKSIADVMLADDESAYSLAVRRLGPLRFRIGFGCSPGPMLGDGGEWDVVFDESGGVVSCDGGAAWIS